MPDTNKGMEAARFKALKSLAGIDQLAPNEKFFVPLNNQVAIAAGPQFYVQSTARQIFQIADVLLDGKSSYYQAEGAGYAATLQQYLNSVNFPIPDLTLAEQNRRNKLETERDVAQEKYNKIEIAALAKFTERPRTKTFDQWAKLEYPAYNTARNGRNGANAALNAALISQNSQDAADLEITKQTLRSAQGPLQEADAFQMGTIDIDEKLPAGQFADQSTKPNVPINYKPTYTVANYREIVGDWVNNYKPGPGQRVNVDTTSTRTDDDNDSSFKSSESASSAHWYLIGGGGSTSSNESSSKIDNYSTKDFQNIAYVIHNYKTFPVTPGGWDIGDVLDRYKGDNPGILKGKYRVTSVIIGYGVDLDIKVQGEAKRQITEALAKDKETNGSGRISIFGFFLGEGGKSKESERHGNKVESWNEETGSLYIKGDLDGYATLLGVIARQID